MKCVVQIALANRGKNRSGIVSFNLNFVTPMAHLWEALRYPRAIGARARDTHRKGTLLVVLLATLVSVPVMGLTSPAQATTYAGEVCANHAFGPPPTVVKICASIGFENNFTLHAHGEAVHTGGAGPVFLRITAVRLYHVNPDELLEMGETDAGWENADADSSPCSYSPDGPHATLYALVGVDANLRGGSIHHWTIRSSNVTVHAHFMDSCFVPD